MQRTTPLWSLAVACLIGCQGFVGDTPSRPGDGERHVPDGVVIPAPETRLPRLTHAQWENTVRDLFGLEGPTGLSDALRADSLPGEAIFDNPGGALNVDEVLWSGYQRAAGDLAETATVDSAIFERIAPPVGGGADRDRAERFVRSFGARAHRRPLTDDEISEYMMLYGEASGLYGAQDDLHAGVRLILEAMLQSPFLLYRVELSSERDRGTIPLDDYEIASRLSYALWDSLPDEELFAAAAAGMLTADPEQVALQARRMLDDPRAEGVFVRFHRQLFDVASFEGITPSTTFFPDAPANLGALATEEHDRFVREIVFGRDGSYRDLLTSPDTFVNAELAAVYGLDGSFGEDFEPVTLDASQRRGVFTQVGFLASNATQAAPDPIHRGVFLAERVACVHIEAPPDDVPPPPVIEGATNRETIANHTEQPGSICAGCHSQIINPFGFPFESYDAIGAWRELDNGHPVDTTGSPPIDGAPTPVSGAVELVDALADSTWAHECYVRHWVERTMGRHAAPEDQALVSALAEGSRDGTLSVRELVVQIVTSRAFLHRSVREVSE
ncbi:MAG: DUF1592 domain-containing protein [Sandaracinaceae bacterium]|nr:MAG: DUF1592 domain-containing protein [Sandaracinaceae bacterium]